MTPANLIAAMLLTAFVIERAIAAGTFVTSFLGLRKSGDVEARRATRRTFWRTMVAGAIAVAVLCLFDWMRLLSTFGVKGYRFGDAALTWLVLVGGTDRLSTFIGAGADAAASPKAKEPLGIHGTLAVDSAGAQALRERAVT